MKHVTITIDGMTCSGCVTAVRNVLERLDGVARATVALGEARIEFDEGKLGAPDFARALVKAGFEARAFADA